MLNKLKTKMQAELEKHGFIFKSDELSLLEILEDYARGVGDYSVVATYAESEEISTDLLLQLAHHEDVEVQLAVASNPKTPTEALPFLAEAWHNGIKLRVANHVNVTPEILTRLSTSIRAEVRAAVANNVKTETSALLNLANNEDWRVRYAVVCNPSTPSETIADLAISGDMYLRAAANNPSLASVPLIIRIRNLGMELLPEHEAVIIKEITRLKEEHGYSAEFPDSWIEKNYLR